MLPRPDTASGNALPRLALEAWSLNMPQDVGLDQMILGGCTVGPRDPMVETVDGPRPSLGTNTHTCWKRCEQLGLIQG